VKKLLTFAPDQRMTGKQAISHPWITNRSARGGDVVNEEVIKNLKRYTDQSKFQRAVRHKMAMHLTTEELHQLRNMFEGLDTDGTGTVSIEELTQAMQDSATNQAAVSALNGLDLKAFDLDGDGQIDWKEFVAGCMQDHQLYNEDNLEKVFKEIDTDKSGTLSLKEISGMLGDSHELKREIMTKLSKHRKEEGGGQLEDLHMTLEEFKAVLKDTGETKDARSRTKGRRNQAHV